jgi:predicted DNA-binding transcriptional regulator YafY
MAVKAKNPRKAARRVDPLERVLNLFTLLHRSTRPLSREQIVAEMAKGMTPYPESDDAQRQLFGSDKNTIVRDLGIQVRQTVAQGDEAGQTKYWISEEDMCVPELDLTNDELSVLSLALASIHHSVPEASEAMMKLEGMNPQRSAVDFNVQVPLIVVRLTEMIQRRQIAHLKINGASVVVDPSRLLFDKGTWYLIAVVDGEKRLRAIKCAHISPDFSIVEGEASSTRKNLSNRELRKLVHNVEDDDVEAQVLVDGHVAGISWWDSRVRETEALPDGKLRITVQVDDPARLRGWVLGFGTHAVIESPTSLRDDFVKWLEQLEQVPESIPSAPAMPTAPTNRPGPRPLGERLQRLLSILPWLRLRGSITVDELARMLGISVAHLIKDLEYASMCGVPPYTHDALFDFSVVDGEVLFHGDVPMFGPLRRTKALMTRAVKLTPRQATAVAVALASHDAVVGDLTMRNEAVTSLRQKIEAAVGDLPIQVRLEDAPLLQEVSQAIRQARQIHVTYVNGEEEVTKRVLNPLLIFVDRGESYLIADDVLTGVDEKIFRIDRLIECLTTENTFEPRTVEFTEWKFRGPVEPAVLYVAPGNDWLLDRIAIKAHVINEDGSMFLWVDVASQPWLARLLLRCGPTSCVVSPANLQSVVAERAREIRQQYT